MSTSEKTAVREHFDDYAGLWHNRITEHRYYARYLVVKDMLRRIGAPMKAVDVGCGTGDYCTLFDPTVTSYVGLDIAPRMIERCRKLYPNYTFNVADGEAIDMPDASVDLVLDVAVIEYFENALPHVKELARIVRPGGTVIIVAPNGSNRTRGFANAVDALVKTVRGKQRKPPEKKVKHARRNVTEITKLGQTAGLRLVEHRYAGVYLLPEVVGLAQKINIAISERISGKSAWEWLTAFSATNLVCRFEKPLS